MSFRWRERRKRRIANTSPHRISYSKQQCVCVLVHWVIVTVFVQASANEVLNISSDCGRKDSPQHKLSTEDQCSPCWKLHA